MGKRITISSGTPWEEEVGYCRAIRVGNIIEVSGTTAMNGDEVIGAGNLYEQTTYILKKIEKALEEAGGKITDVVRTRMFITDISQWEIAGKAHGEFFRQVKPVSTMVEVSRLISPELLIEIEASAIVETDV